MNNHQIIPIFFTIDEGYAPYLDCAIRSMADHADPNRNYKIHVLYENLSDDSIRKLQDAAGTSFETEFLEMKEGLGAITDREENKLRCDYFTLTIYFRLFIAELFPHYDKAIYIDSDIIVNEDISKLYDIPLQGKMLGACTDLSIMGVPELRTYLEKAIGVEPETYINSGVLLMNLKKMRQLDLTGHFMHLLNTYHFDTVAPDQDYLNAMCHGDILYLDPSWDAMPPETEDAQVLEAPNIIHYNLFQKPWCYDDIPYEDYFWKYAEQSPFYETIRAHKEGYSQEQKEYDAKCMSDLIEKASQLHLGDVTFCKMNEQGVKIRTGE